MSVEDKEQLVADAAAEGVSVQTLLERRLFGRHDAGDRMPGRTPKSHQHPELFNLTA